jgi:hypothetical protein
MNESDWLLATDLPATVTPTAFGDSDFRQRFYRRGGTLPDNWFLVGENMADGDPFEDAADDLEIAASATLPIDHFQPVPTVDADGVTVLGQAVPIIWGPMDGLIFAIGDPHRPGHVYWSLPGQPDYWPAENTEEVCSPSEELMNGGVYAGTSFVFSRMKMYQLYSNVVTGQGVTSTASGCTEGLVARWGMAIGHGGIFFVARDGVRVTTGGASRKISDPIASLFNGVTRNGHAPIDFAEASRIRLGFHANDLWFIYMNIHGDMHTMVFNMIDQMPYRELGGQLTGWDDLSAIHDWANSHNIPFHMDGARLWQCRPFYQKSYQEIAALFDSVYVSFYKDLGGLSGSALLGPNDFIKESRVWLRRHGGNLKTQFPFWTSARLGLNHVVPQIDQWVKRARETAAILSQFDQITILPDPPHVNFFHLYIRGDAEALTERHLELAKETGIFIFRGLQPAPVPGLAVTELQIAENSLAFDLEKLAPFVDRLLDA